MVISGIVLLVATWNCLISYKNGYAGLYVFHLLSLLNPWLFDFKLVRVFSVDITLVDVHLNLLYWFHFLIKGGVLVILPGFSNSGKG